MLYLLRFTPVFKHYLWGGNRLREQFSKPLATEQTCAESWELVDRRAKDPAQFHEQSVVAFGPLAGQRLGDLVDQHAKALLGQHAPQPRFPLLVKVLDAAQALSVQVHPNDSQARTLPSPDLGKTEAWVVMHAEPGAMLYAGLKPGVDRHTLEQAIIQGDCERFLNTLEPRAGDCIFLPAGVVHALGAGLVIAEIQQSSDVTYRLYDWNRTGPDGLPRELHIEQGLDVIDFDAGPVGPAVATATGRPHVERLVTCDKFVLDRWTIDAPESLGGNDRAEIVIVLEGAVQIENDPSGQPLRAGETALIPASVGATTIVPSGRAILLNAYLP